MLILQDINHIELIELKHKMYSSFDTIIQNIKDNELLQNTINEDRISERSLQLGSLSNKVNNIFPEKINVHVMDDRKSFVENSNNLDILLNNI